MKKITFLLFILCTLCINYLQAQNNSWKLQFSKEITPKTQDMVGFVKAGTDFYAANKNSATLYRINDNSEIVETINIPGRSKSVKAEAYFSSLAWDGKNLYYVNIDQYIYKFSDDKKSVIDSIKMPNDNYVMAIAYDPQADSGKGGFWSVFSNCNLYLISMKGEILNTITAQDLHYVSSFCALAVDTTAPAHIYALTQSSQSISSIDINSKQTDAPAYELVKYFPDWKTESVSSIYLADNIVKDSKTLGLLYETGYHIGYDLSSIKGVKSIGVQSVGTEMKTDVKLNDQLTVFAKYKLTGTEAMTSCKMNYAINGITTTCDIEGEYNNFFNEFTLTHTTPYTANQGGYNTMSIWLSKINDNDSINSDTLFFTFNTHEISLQRVVLHEAFSSATCSPCKAGNKNLHNILQGQENVVCIKYQMNWPGNGDPYCTTEGLTRKNYYNVKSIPYLAVDGKVFNGSTSGYSSKVLEQELLKSAYIEMESAFAFNGKKGFSATVSATLKENSDANFRLFVALVEKETYNNIADEYLKQYGASTFNANFDTIFYCVMKKFLTPSNGLPIDLSKAGDTYTRDFNYEFQGDYRLPKDAIDPINLSTEHSVENFNNIFLVYWIQDYQTKEVFQAGSNSTNSVGLPNVETKDNRIAVYPNPVRNLLNIQSQNNVQRIEIFNLMGQKVIDTHDTEINTSDLTSGVYVVRVATDKGIATSKFVKE